MVCYHPLCGYKITERDGSVNVWVLGSIFDYDNFKTIQPYYYLGKYYEPIIIPCGQCIGCRLERSRQWAVRCIHEAQLYSHNCFLTLTYDDAYLPSDGSLHKEDLQKFWKRLRKVIYPAKLRYFACGEYGSLLNRPHYHAIVFNYRPPDQQLLTLRGGSKIYISDIIKKCWPYGFHTIGDVTFESAAYVARYILKKVTGSQSEFHYDGLEPEFTVMSRRPGIAREWFKKFHGDVYPNDYIVIRDNIKCRPPKYYDKLYDELFHNLDYIKYKRLDNHNSLSWQEIKRKEKYAETYIKNRLKRNLEDS